MLFYSLLSKCFVLQDIIPICESDIDYQVSTSTLEANWEVPANYKDIIRSTFWSIDKKSPVGGKLLLYFIT